MCGHPFRIVSSSLLVCRSELEEAILDVVIGGSDAAYLYKKSKRGGGAMPTRMYDDLLALIAHFDPAARARGDSEVVHYCCVLPGSAEESRGLPTGGPCCVDVRESVEKTAAAWLNFIAGRGWARSAESRWTNITTNAKRLVVVVNLLGGAIDDVRLKWDLPFGLEAALERLVSENKGDQAGWNKLTLLRTVRAFTDPIVQAKMAIYVTTATIADQIHYAILGHEQQHSITVLGLVDPEVSPVGIALDSLAMLLDVWGPEARGWVLLSSLAVDFSDPSVRQFAQVQILGLVVGLLDYFELRLTKPPYTVAAAAGSGSAEALDRAIREMRSMPLQCLPLSCQRMRARYPTEAALREFAPPVFLKLLDKVPASIAFAERQHAQMRQDLLTTKRARSFTASSNRTFCKQALAEHVRRGGSDPARAGPAALVACMRASDPVAAPLPIADAAPASAKKLGPSRPAGPFIAFQSKREAAFKQLVAPGRKLTAVEQQRMKDAVRSGWDQVKRDAQVARYTAEARATFRVKKNSVCSDARALAEEAVVPLAPFKSVWGGSSNPQHVVEPDTIVAHAQKLGGLRHRDAEAWADDTLSVESAVDAVVRGGWGRSVFGCCDGRTVCTSHGSVSFDLAQRVDELTNLLTEWASTLGKEAISTMSRVVWLHADWGDEPSPLPPRPDVLVLLTSQRLRPTRVQYFAVCEVGVEWQRYFDELPQLPFFFRLAVGPGKISPGKRSPLVSTSGDLALDLASRAPTARWRLLEVAARPVDAVGNVKTFEALGHDAEFVMPPPRRATPCAPPACSDEVLSLSGDPFAAQPCGPLSGRAGPAPGLVDPAMQAHEDEEEDDLIGCAPFDLEPLDVVGELDVGARSDSASELGSGPDVGDGGDEALRDAMSLEVGLVGFDDEVDSSDAPPAPTIQDFVRGSAISFSGFVSCTLPPWRDILAIGKITVFPVMVPPQQQMASVRCYLRPGCSFMMRRPLVTNEELLAWLYSGSRAADGRGEVDVVREEHAAAWATLKDRCASRLPSRSSAESSVG